MKITSNPLTYTAPDTNWHLAFQEDFDCVGTFIQNQEVTANFWLCKFQPVLDQEARKYFPGATQYDDRLPWQEAVWIKSDTQGAVLTFERIYNQG